MNLENLLEQLIQSLNQIKHNSPERNQAKQKLLKQIENIKFPLNSQEQIQIISSLSQIIDSMYNGTIKKPQ